MRVPKHAVLLVAILLSLFAGWILGAGSAHSASPDPEPSVSRPATLAETTSTTAVSMPTTAETTTTTTAPTTTTSTLPPAPPVAPAPAPAAPMDRARAAYAASVPAAWRDAVSPRFILIDGWTSWAFHDRTIQVSFGHATGPFEHLRAVIAHEVGHLIAFQWGSQEFNGAAPQGWPGASSNRAETWADCVSRAFTDIDDPSTGLPSCAGDALAWTKDWLAAGPAAHAPTR